MEKKLWKIRSEKLSGKEIPAHLKSLDIRLYSFCKSLDNFQQLLFNGLRMEGIFKEIIPCNFKKPIRTLLISM